MEKNTLYRQINAIKTDSGGFVRSAERVNDLGEVFTPTWLVRDMLNLMPDDPTARVDTRCLDPACGNGQFLAEALRRKLSTAAQRYMDVGCRSSFQYDALTGLAHVHGVDIDRDNVRDGRERLAGILCETYTLVLNAKVPACFQRAVAAIVSANVICGDFLVGQFELIEWVRRGRGRFARRIWGIGEMRIGAAENQLSLLSEPRSEIPAVHWSKL